MLKPGGILEVWVPSITEVCRSIAAGRPLDEVLYQSPVGPIRAIDILYGCGRLIFNGKDLMRHKTGFGADSLSAALKRGGFSVEALSEAKAFELTALAKRPEAGVTLS